MPHVQGGLLWRLRRARKLPDARAAGLRDTDRMPDGALRYDERFEGAAAAELALARAELEACNSVACDLTEASPQGARLTACRFERCELALADLADASLRDVTFERCRLTGVDFGRLERDPLGLEARFEGCDLSFALFRGLDLRAFAFEGCLLPEAEFTRCDLRGVSFAGSDLARCGFADCDLRDADLRAARGYLVSPFTNRVRGMRVTLPEAVGLLAVLEVVVEWGPGRTIGTPADRDACWSGRRLNGTPGDRDPGHAGVPLPAGAPARRCRPAPGVQPA